MQPKLLVGRQCADRTTKPGADGIERWCDPIEPATGVTRQVNPFAADAKVAVLAFCNPYRGHALEGGEANIRVGIAQQHPMLAAPPAMDGIERGHVAAKCLPDVGNEARIGARPKARICAGQIADCGPGCAGG